MQTATASAGRLRPASSVPAMTDCEDRRPIEQRRSAASSGLCQRLDERIEDVARRLLGKPNAALSTRSQLRFGRNGSLAIELERDKRGQWYDHEHKIGGGAFDLVRRYTGLSGSEAAEWVAAEFGLPCEQRQRQRRKRILATYDYRDEAGRLLFQVVRYEPKTFRQRRPDGNGGWSWRVRGVRPVPYRLSELQAGAADDLVFIVEGEKDADRLASLGFVATCNAGGAGNHASKVAAALHGIAENVRIVAVPDLAPGGDVSDWLDAGGDRAGLLQLCQAAPEWGQNEGCPQPDDPVLLPYCEEALTLVFSERHIDHLRYCEAFGKWFEWDDGRWREDVKRRVFSHARKLCRAKSAAALAGIEHEKAATRISATVASAKTVAAVVNLARADARHATAPEDWDADPWALNTPMGSVDLRTGQMRPHKRAALCSKMTAVAPAHSA